MCYLCQFEIGALDKGLLDLSVSEYFCLSFWCVSILFEVHCTCGPSYLCCSVKNICENRRCVG